MGGVVISLAMAFVLAGCGVVRGAPVPLSIDESVTRFGESCILMHVVVDVTADPVDGRIVLNDGTKVVDMKWPKGFTAWRSGMQTQVANASGIVVLTTGARYYICPSEYLNGWVAGAVKPCPDCKLGFQLD